MKRPESHETKTLAELFLAGKLPTKWVINPHPNDYGKDFDVEVVDSDGTVTGSNFYVRVKGTQAVRKSGDGKSVKFSLESKYAEYYAQIEQTPVLLVVVDITKQMGWWLFLQRYLDTHKGWKTKNSLTIDIPVENTLEDIPRLSKAFYQAVHWLRAKHPTALRNSILAVKETIESLDPRFSANVSYSNNTTHVSLSSVVDEPISIMIDGRTDQAKLKLGEMIGFGKRVRFEPGELQIDGSGILKAFSERPIELHCATLKKGSVELEIQDESGHVLSRLEIPGDFTGGSEQIRFESDPVIIPVVRLSTETSAIGGELRMRLEMALWNGKPLLNLPGFDKCKQFLESLVNSQSVGMSFFIEGNICGEVIQMDFQVPKAESFSVLISALGNARRIFRHFRLNPTLQLDQINVEFLEAVDKVSRLLFKDGEQTMSPDYCRRYKLSADQTAPQNIPETFFVDKLNTNGSIGVQLLGHKLSLGVLHQEITNVSVRKINEGSIGFSLEVTGTETTVIRQHLEKPMRTGANAEDKV